MIKNHKKIADDKVQFDEIKKDKENGVVVGTAYGFLFEGDNNDYDEEYGDYI